MSTLLKVDIEGMYEELERLKEAIEVFRTYATEGFNREIGMVEGMQSDFTPILKDILKNMKDNSDEKVLQGMEEYHSLGLTIVEILKKDTDEGMAQKMGVKADG